MGLMIPAVAIPIQEWAAPQRKRVLTPSTVIPEEQQRMIGYMQSLIDKLEHSQPVSHNDLDCLAYVALAAEREDRIQEGLS